MGERRGPWQRPVWHATAAFALGVVLLVADFPLVSEWSVLPAQAWARLGVLAGMGALQLARERAPLAAFLAGLPLLGLDLAMGLTLPVLVIAADQLCSTVIHGPHRAVRIIKALLVLYVAGVVVVAVLTMPTLRGALLLVMATAPLPALPVWWGLNVRAQRERAEAERARADNLERIAELDRSAAVLAERARMARDLHDIVAGHLSAIAIQSEALLGVPGGHPERVEAVLRSMRENSVASLTEMRAMIGLLRTGEPDPLTAPARLRELDGLVRSARAAGLTVRAGTGPTGTLTAAVDHSAYRILQEALTNAVKHAPGANAEVTVHRADDVLVLEVLSDRPAGEHRDGLGLATMSERARAVGGVLVAGPCASGWRVRAELPL